MSWMITSEWTSLIFWNIFFWTQIVSQNEKLLKPTSSSCWLLVLAKSWHMLYSIPETVARLGESTTQKGTNPWNLSTPGIYPPEKWFMLALPCLLFSMLLCIPRVRWCFFQVYCIDSGVKTPRGLVCSPLDLVRLQLLSFLTSLGNIDRWWGT